MPTEVFSIPGQFTVFRAEDGAISWSSSYRGMKVVAALPIDGERYLILLDTAASKQEVFENLLCVERSGNVVWKAELPDQPDAFVKFEMVVDGLRAWTWSGWMLRLDPATGKILERQFVK
jgi:outer membrane protein assembly factor BamB